MSPFEYVSVLISIIYGLGITLVLTGVAELIRRWKTSRPFWPYFIWIALVFVLHIYEWWEHYALRLFPSWSLPMFLFVILYPILLFILANLLFPLKWSKKGVNLKAFYFLNYPKFFLCVILLAALSIVQNIVLSNYMLQDQLVQFAILIIFSIMLIRPIQNIAVHTILAILMLITMLISLFLTRDSLIISN